jgi:hypothetical protein
MLDSFKVYRNILEDDPTHADLMSTEYTLSTFEYDGNMYTVNGSTVAGGLILASSSDEYEFDDNLLVRFNTESYTYEDGLLVERINSMGSKTKSRYTYEGDLPVRIISSRYSGKVNDYVPIIKYEFEYEGDSVFAERYGYNEQDQEWILLSSYRCCYSGGHMSARESYQYSNGEAISYYKATYEYNEQGDLILLTESDSEGWVNVTEYEYTYVFDDYGNITERAYASGDNTGKILYYYENGGSNVDVFNIPNGPDYYFFNLNMYTNGFKR